MDIFEAVDRCYRFKKLLFQTDGSVLSTTNSTDNSTLLASIHRGLCPTLNVWNFELNLKRRTCVSDSSATWLLPLQRFWSATQTCSCSSDQRFCPRKKLYCDAKKRVGLAAHFHCYRATQKKSGVHGRLAKFCQELRYELLHSSIVRFFSLPDALGFAAGRCSTVDTALTLKYIARPLQPSQLLLFF